MGKSGCRYQQNPLLKSLARTAPAVILPFLFFSACENDVDPPEITINKPQTNPAPDGYYTNLLPIDIEVYDNESINRVDVFLNGDRLPLSGKKRITGEIDISNPGTGSFSFEVQAWDEAGNFTDKSIAVTLKMETVTAPAISGPPSGKTNTSLAFTLSGGSSNLNHSLEYYIDWGDGSIRNWSPSTSAQHSWSPAGPYSIRAMARCIIHTSAESNWSSLHQTTVSDLTITGDINPTAIDFSTVNIGQSEQRSATISNALTSQANLTGSVSITGSEYSLATGSSGSFNISVGDSKDIFITFNPSLPEGTKSGTVTINHDATNISSPTTISFTGYAQEKPDTINMTISPGSVDFGSVLVGQTADASVTISNAASSTAGLSGSISLSGTGFSITSGGGSFTVAPGGNPHTVGVRFSPASVTTYNGSLSFSHNATNSGTPAVVTLAGSGSQESVSVPTTPSGTTSGLISTFYSYTTGGATSDQGHSVQYQFDWGDGTQSGWSSSTSASHSWSSANTYSVLARARCATHTNVVSGWSGNLAVIISGESISTPSTPTGQSSLCTGTSVSYTTSGSTSNLGHSVQYQFEINGSIGSWSSSLSISGSFNTGSYSIRVRARCATHTSIVSNLSGTKTVTVNSETIGTPSTPSGQTDGDWNVSYGYVRGSASSSCGHSLQYRFSWGDGTYSNWSTSTVAYHSWSQRSSYSVRTQARCATHTSIVSNFSSARTVVIHSTGELYSGNVSVNVPIPDNGCSSNNKGTVTFTLSGAPAGAVITNVNIEYWIAHTYVSDLLVWLTTQSGSTWYDETLWNHEGGSSDNIHDIDISTRWNNLSANRTWYLVACDGASQDAGYFYRYAMRVTWRY